MSDTFSKRKRKRNYLVSSFCSNITIIFNQNFPQKLYSKCQFNYIKVFGNCNQLLFNYFINYENLYIYYYINFNNLNVF